MSLKKLLAIPLLISLGFFIYFSVPVAHDLKILVGSIQITPALITALVVAIILQLIGHVIRARKTTVLFDKVKKSSVRFHFRAISVGHLFNAILPFRLGELVRARIISGAMTISFSYALTLIIFERLIDAMILGAFGVVIILAFADGNKTVLLTYAVALMVVSAILLVMIVLLMHQNRTILRIWHKMTSLLNDDLKNSARFKGWSVVYGLQHTMKRSIMRRYLTLTAISWLFYAASLFVVIQYYLGTHDVNDKAALVVAPYYAVAVPSGPANLGVFSNVVNQFTQFMHLDSDAVISFNLTMWAVLVLPVALIGVVLLFGKTRETLWQNRPKKSSRLSLENKLFRQEDISDDMKHFLDNYFSGNSLSKIVHELELSEGFRLVRYFKGGSDAITILALQDGVEVVKKIIPLEFEDRLKAQYDWLEQRNGTPGIVQVLTEERAGDYYSIDLAYDPRNEMFYEFIHRNTIARSYRVMDEVWSSLYSKVYGSVAPLKAYPQDRRQYIDKHIFGCLDKASDVDPELLKAVEPEKLVVNGIEYDNLRQIMERIKKHPQAWKDIATYQRSGAVHGDVIVDNLLVHEETGKVLIIDPAPDGNIISGPVFDFGKNLQSLYCGYETLLRDEDRVTLTNGNEIKFRDHSSDKYHQLADYVRNELAPRYLSEAEQRAMLFHAATLFIRRLKHQVFYTPANVLKFYAVGVKTLNDFMTQYDEPSAALIAKALKPTSRPKKK